MRVFVPYTYRYPPTWEALAPYEPAGVVMDADAGYLAYMRERWREGADFVNVEHDVIVQDCQLESLDACPLSWCCFPEYLGGPPTLSIVRFRASFIEANRDVWEGLSPSEGTVEPVRRSQPLWTLLDSYLVAHADRECHLHGPPWARNVRPVGSLH